jgi:transcriptional regulator with XRE-family HTH domain
MSAPHDIQKQLREAIAASGLSLNQLGEKSGVSDGQLSRFMRGERTLTMETASPLCRVLGLELRPAAPETPAARKGKGK